jgi:hypothetical protein
MKIKEAIEEINNPLNEDNLANFFNDNNDEVFLRKEVAERLNIDNDE